MTASNRRSPPTIATALPPLKPLLHPKYWGTWAMVAAVRILALLPLTWLQRIGRVLGPLLLRRIKSRQRVAKRNIERCFPELSEDERAALLHEHGQQLGMMLAELVKVWFASQQALYEAATVNGLEHVREIQAQGQGVLVIAGHFTTLEICGHQAGLHFPFAALYRAHKQPVLEYLVRRARLRDGEAVFRRRDIRHAIKYLRAGGALWYAPDQDYVRSDAVFAPFFGVQANTIKSTATLARMGRARVLMMQQLRLANGRYEINISPPLVDFPTDNEVFDATRINAEIEKLVRAAPAQYLWIHRRFKTRPEGEPAFYG